MSKEFKAGDLVYYPQMGHGIFIVQSPRRSITYPVKICQDGGFTEFLTADGKMYESDKAAIIFHATPENYALLKQLHGVEFEEPPIMELPE